MKIVFLCGSLEPGRNGVGDYVNCLAGGLLKKGVSAYSIAFNDHFVEDWQFDKFCHRESIHHVLRIGNNVSNEKKNKIARDWIEELQPDWLSLQYVPFSFHKKGIPFSLNKRLEKLGVGHNWHIMFHELWVGIEDHSSWKLRFLSLIQKFIIWDLLKSLKPNIVHTHATLYRDILHIKGWKVSQLPLFGNIRSVQRRKKSISSKKINIAVFGSIYPGAKLKKFIAWLRSQNLEMFCFHFLGNNGKELEEWLRILRENNVVFELYGWLTEEDLSCELHKCYLGITSTPYYLVEKSGSVAAMLEHGLEVICIGEDWIPRGIKPTQINIPVKNFIENMNFQELNIPGASQGNVNLRDTVSKFIKGLENP